MLEQVVAAAERLATSRVRAYERYNQRGVVSAIYQAQGRQGRERGHTFLIRMNTPDMPLQMLPALKTLPAPIHSTHITPRPAITPIHTQRTHNCSSTCTSSSTATSDTGESERGPEAADDDERFTAFADGYTVVVGVGVGVGGGGGGGVECCEGCGGFDFPPGPRGGDGSRTRATRARE